jgi:hypothetical protein
MLVVFGFALLVLAAAIVVLFAMMGELSSRVPEPGAARRDASVRPVENAKIGHTPGVWPAGLPDPLNAVILVLSTACGACEEIARQLSADPAHADWPEVALVVSTAGRRTGENFLAAHGLERFPHYIDEGGEWTSGEFDVRLSPTALVLRSGRLASAHVFNDVASLRDAIAVSEPEQKEQQEELQKEQQKEVV